VFVAYFLAHDAAGVTDGSHSLNWVNLVERLTVQHVLIIIAQCFWLCDWK